MLREYNFKDENVRILWIKAVDFSVNMLKGHLM